MHILDSKHAWTSELYVVGDLGDECCYWISHERDCWQIAASDGQMACWHMECWYSLRNRFRKLRLRKCSQVLTSFNEPSKLTETLLTRTDAHPDCICAARVLYFENIFISTNHFCVVDRKRQCQTVFGWHHSKRCYPNGGCRFICTIDCHFPLYKLI